jgi:hypothetical protein
MQNPATQREAEEAILKFRHSAQPVPACMHVLQHSSVVEARFHAALTIRVATLDEWSLLISQAKADLRQWLLRSVLQPSMPDPTRVVTKALIAAYATLVKRAWLELDDQQRDDLMQARTT